MNIGMQNKIAAARPYTKSGAIRRFLNIIVSLCGTYHITQKNHSNDKCFRNTTGKPPWSKPKLSRKLKNNQRGQALKAANNDYQEKQYNELNHISEVAAEEALIVFGKGSSGEIHTGLFCMLSTNFSTIVVEN